MQTIDDKIAALVPEVNEKLRQRLNAELRTLREANNPRSVINNLSGLCLCLIDIVLESVDEKRPSDNLQHCIFRIGVGNKDKGRGRQTEGLGLLPRTMWENLDTLRKWANPIDHEDRSVPNPTIADAENNLSLLLRVLEWFYCEYANGSRLSSIYSNLILARTDAEEWPSTLLTREPAEQQSTTAFAEEAQRLLEILAQGRPLVAIVAAPGTGKSRLAAALFHREYSGDVQPVWFRGGSVDELLQSIGQVRRKYPQAKLQIVLDEDHQQPVRNEQFFGEFFERGAWQAIRGQHQVVLALRTSTYNALDKRSLLVGTEVIELACTARHLEYSQLWGMDRPFTVEERNWIGRTASDDKGDLISFLVDRVCIPHIKAGGILEDTTLGQGRSILETVYQGLIACRSESDRQLMEAICIAGQHGSFSPLWLITAVLRAMGRDVTPEEVDDELEGLEDDGLMTRREVELEPVAHSWRFVHDLLNESLKARLSGKRRQRVEWKQIEDAAVQLVEAKAGENLEAFANGLAMWVAVITKRKDGVLLIINELVVSNGELSRQSGDKSRFLRSIAIAVRYVQRHMRGLADWGDSGNYKALVQLAEMARKHVSQDQVAEICKGQLAVSPLLGLGHAVALMGIACGKWTKGTFLEETESKIAPLISIGDTCTKISTEEAFQNIPDFIPRIRYAQLLMWAGRWEDAGDAVLLAMRSATEEGKESVYIILHYTGIATQCYLAAGHHDKIIEAFTVSIGIAVGDTKLRHLCSQLETNIEIVANWNEGAKQWKDLMAEWHSRLLENGGISTKHIFVVSDLSHATGSTVCAVLAKNNIDCDLVYAAMLNELAELPESTGIVIIGGHLSHDIYRLMNCVVSSEQYAKRALIELQPPDYGVTEFCVGNRPGIWVSAWYPWDTIDAVGYWLKNGGAERLANRVRQAGNSDAELKEYPNA